MTTELTPKETQALLQTAEAMKAYSNGPQEQFDGEVWSNCIEDYGDLRGKTLSGLIGSLCKKGFLFSDGEVVYMTSEGRTQVNSTHQH